MNRAAIQTHGILAILFLTGSVARADMIIVTDAYYEYHQTAQILAGSEYQHTDKLLTGIPSSNGFGDVLSVARGDNSAFSRVVANLNEFESGAKQELNLRVTFTNQVRSPVDPLARFASNTEFYSLFAITFDVTEPIDLAIKYHAGADEFTSLQPDSYLDSRTRYYALFARVGDRSSVIEFGTDADLVQRLEPGRYVFAGDHAITRKLFGGTQGDPGAVRYVTTSGVVDVRLTATAVPEPASVGQLSLGLIGAGLGWRASRRRRDAGLRA